MSNLIDSIKDKIGTYAPSSRHLIYALNYKFDKTTNTEEKNKIPTYINDICQRSDQILKITPHLILETLGFPKEDLIYFVGIIDFYVGEQYKNVNPNGDIAMEVLNDFICRYGALSKHYSDIINSS